jgi:hypothetical protein
VALEATFRELSFSLHRLHDALNDLHVTLGDKPVDDQSAIADGLETAVLDLMGTLHEARRGSLDARRAVGHPLDLDQARHSLALCQERFHRIEQQFSSDLVSYEKLRELARLGSTRRAWLPWTNAVKLGIDQCRQPLERARTALASCWQEVAERVGTTSISVRNAIVGQKVIAREPRAKDEFAERMT